jgi:hypothetical protein
VQGVLLELNELLVAISEFTPGVPLNRTERGKALIALKKEFVADLSTSCKTRANVA